MISILDSEFEMCCDELGYSLFKPVDRSPGPGSGDKTSVSAVAGDLQVHGVGDLIGFREDLWWDEWIVFGMQNEGRHHYLMQQGTAA